MKFSNAHIYKITNKINNKIYIGKVYNNYYIERVLISHQDDQLKPARAEWIYVMDNTSYQCAVMSKKVFSSGAQVIFIEDNLLDDFINKEYVNAHTIYIRIHSFQYIKQVDLVRKAFKNVHFLINIKEFPISDYARLKEFADETLLIFLNGQGDERFSKAIFREVFMYHSNYLIEEGLLESNSHEIIGKTINFRTFGLIRDEDLNYRMLDTSIRDVIFLNDSFTRLRSELGLPVGTDVPNTNAYRSDSPFIL